MSRGGVPRATDEVVERRMRRQRRRDTAAEISLRSALWRRGLRFRVDFPVIGRRRVDVAFPRQRVAVFVDGCFWHRCPLHGTIPRANRDWWLEKLEANAERDRGTNVELEACGWLVIRVWEHEAPDAAAERVAAAVRARQTVV